MTGRGKHDCHARMLADELLDGLEMLGSALATANDEHVIVVGSLEHVEVGVVGHMGALVVNGPDDAVETVGPIGTPGHDLLLRDGIGSRDHIGQHGAPVILVQQGHIGRNRVTQDIEVHLKSLTIQACEQQLNVEVTGSAAHTQDRTIDRDHAALDSRECIDERKLQVVVSMEAKGAGGVLTKD